MPAQLLIGDSAPPFHALAVGRDYPPEGSEISLESLHGQKIVLYFYPGNDTPGCTEQACAIRDACSEFQQHAKLFGINHDSPVGHRRFIEKFALPFPLISDPGDEIAKAYGLWLGEGGGDVEGGEATERSTFIINADGRIERVLRRVKPAEHAHFLLDILK